MARRSVVLLSVVTAALGTATAVPQAQAIPTRAAPPAVARSAPLASSPHLSVTTRLADRREVAAGTRAYSLGFEDGGFYANGWHITGEMGGVWSPPVKLVDGVWFGVGGRWVGPATKFTSGWGYTRYALPDVNGLHLQRTDFVPDGTRAALFGLTVTNPGKARTTALKIDTHSELMGQYPWGFDGVTPNAKDNLPDKGSYDGRHLVFTDNGTLPAGAPHHYSAVVGTSLQPTAGHIGHSYWGPRPGHRCTGKETGAPAAPEPSACDDGPFGNGTGGELTYRVALPAHGSRTIWLAVAGSDSTVAASKQSLTAALRSPARQLAAKVAHREALSRWTQLNLPGDRLVQHAISWGKQNLADLTLRATNLKIRWTNQGKQYPKPLGTIKSAGWIGAGYPDYPWIFGTDAEYTAFAAVATGQFAGIKAHMRTLQQISDILNHGDGIVVHESVSDGSIYFGHDSKHTNADGTTTNDFNTDETVKFPSTVALIWRWTGDNSFRDALYNFCIRNLRHAVNKLDADKDGWPEGSGNVEVTGMGPEKLDNAVYLIRGLYDLADMARSKNDVATARWASNHGHALQRKFEQAWWHASAHQYADSLHNPDNAQIFQKHWIGEVPMEAEMHLPAGSVPGLASYRHGTAALAQREGTCYSGSRPLNRGLFHTGCNGGADGKGSKVIFGLTTSIASIGEGNYGRLGAGHQRRYTHALAETMFNEPETGNTPDEMPGAMPEIFPSPDQGANIDRCWTCRSMFMQAWGNYGTAWAVVHQWLGVNPDLGRHAVAFVAQVPRGQNKVAGNRIRLGNGYANVLAMHYQNRHRTLVDVTKAVGARTVVIGTVLPRGTAPRHVMIDGHRARHYTVRTTNRGTQVTVRTHAGRHAVVVTT